MVFKIFLSQMALEREVWRQTPWSRHRGIAASAWVFVTSEGFRWTDLVAKLSATFARQALLPITAGSPILTGLLAFLFAILVGTSGCVSLHPLPRIDFHQPGWTVRQGQAVWRLEHRKQEIAGELLVAN